MEFTKQIKGYLFQTEQEAQNAIYQINTILGIPVSEDATTRTYCTFENMDNKIFIRHDETIESVLGLPTQFEVTYTIEL